MKILLGISALTVFVFCPITLPGIPDDFFLSGRWLMLGLLVLAIILFHFRIRAHATPVILMLSAFSLYAGVTVAWSENPLLSAAKSVGFLATTVTMLMTGLLLGGQQAHEGKAHPFNALAPLYLTGIFSTALQIALAPGLAVEDGKLYGMTRNPNYLGGLIAFSSVWLITELLTVHWRWLYGVFLIMIGILGIIFVVMTWSRSALIVFISIICAALISRRAGGIVPVFAVVLLLMGIFIVVGGDELSAKVTAYVYKGKGEILESRQGNFSQSRDAAEAAGAFGFGFGVSKGMAAEWESGLSTGKAKREKGNSQMAVVEELGWVRLTVVHRTGLRRLKRILGGFRGHVRESASCLLGGLGVCGWCDPTLYCRGLVHLTRSAGNRRFLANSGLKHRLCKNKSGTDTITSAIYSFIEKRADASRNLAWDILD